MAIPTDRHAGPPGPASGEILGRGELTMLDQSPSSPSRALDWRRAVALHLARSGSRSWPRWVDAPARRAIRHLRSTSPRSSPSRPDAPLVAALALRSDHAPAIRTAVEALLLAGLDDLAIAARVRLGPRVIAAYHDLWYDVRPLLPHPDAIIVRALGPGLYAPAVDRETAIRHLAYSGGPAVALALVDAVVLPASAAGDPGRLEETASLFEEILLAWSIPAETRSIPALLGLEDRARRMGVRQFARTRERPSRPVAFGALEASAVRAGGPDRPVLASTGRAEGTFEADSGTPDSRDAAIQGGPTGVLERLAVAV